MNQEMRKAMRRDSMAAGDVQLELQEVKKIQKSGSDGFMTLTVTCSNWYTIICCE